MINKLLSIRMEDLLFLNFLRKIKKFTIILKRIAIGLKKDEMYKCIVGLFNIFVSLYVAWRKCQVLTSCLHDYFWRNKHVKVVD